MKNNVDKKQIIDNNLDMNDTLSKYDTNLELTLNEFATNLMKNQKDLPSEIQQYLNEHMMDLI